MSLQNQISLLLFFISTVIFLVKYPQKSYSDIEYMIYKLIPLFSLIILLAINRIQHNTPYLTKIFIGLILCSIGDVLICREEYFLFAVGFFGIAHIVYIFAFGFKQFKPYLAILNLTIFFITLYLIVPKIEIPELKLILPIYMVVLLTMIWRAMALVQINKINHSQIFAALGAISFGFSDIILCVDSFINKLSNGNFLILITYYVAQLCIALSAVYFKSNEIKTIQKKIKKNH